MKTFYITYDLFNHEKQKFDYLRCVVVARNDAEALNIFKLECERTTGYNNVVHIEQLKKPCVVWSH